MLTCLCGGRVFPKRLRQRSSHASSVNNANFHRAKNLTLPQSYLTSYGKRNHDRFVLATSHRMPGHHLLFTTSKAANVCGKPIAPSCQNNWSIAEKRLKQFKKWFERDPEFAAQYKAMIDDYIAKGYTVKLSKDEWASACERTWYFPHHGVVNPKKAWSKWCMM